MSGRAVGGAVVGLEVHRGFPIETRRRVEVDLMNGQDVLVVPVGVHQHRFDAQVPASLRRSTARWRQALRRASGRCGQRTAASLGSSELDSASCSPRRPMQRRAGSVSPCHALRHRVGRPLDCEMQGRPESFACAGILARRRSSPEMIRRGPTQLELTRLVVARRVVGVVLGVFVANASAASDALAGRLSRFSFGWARWPAILRGRLRGGPLLVRGGRAVPPRPGA